MTKCDKVEAGQNECRRRKEICINRSSRRDKGWKVDSWFYDTKTNMGTIG